MCQLCDDIELTGVELLEHMDQNHFPASAGNLVIDLYASVEKGSLQRALQLAKLLRPEGVAFCAFGWNTPFRMKVPEEHLELVKDLARSNDLVVVD